MQMSLSNRGGCAGGGGGGGPTFAGLFFVLPFSKLTLLVKCSYFSTAAAETPTPKLPAAAAAAVEVK